MEANGDAERLYERWWGQQSRLKFAKRTFKFDSDQVAQ